MSLQFYPNQNSLSSRSDKEAEELSNARTLHVNPLFLPKRPAHLLYFGSERPLDVIRRLDFVG